MLRIEAWLHRLHGGWLSSQWHCRWGRLHLHRLLVPLLGVMPLALVPLLQLFLMGASRRQLSTAPIPQCLLRCC